MCERCSPQYVREMTSGRRLFDLHVQGVDAEGFTHSNVVEFRVQQDNPDSVIYFATGARTRRTAESAAGR
jgi:hypothetical protein